MLRKTALSLLLLVTAACGGGGESSDNGSNSGTTTPVSVTNDITGTWLEYVEEFDCKEVYQFYSDSTFSVQTGGEFIEGVFTFENTVSTGQAHKLELTFESQNGEADCQGDRGNIVGQIATLFIKFNSDHQLSFYASVDAVEVITELDRNVPIDTNPLSTAILAGERASISLIQESYQLINPQLLYGPQGMTFDANGVIHWQPDNLFFTREQEYNFAISAENSIEDKLLVVRVVDDLAQQPLVRTGIEIPYSSNNLWVADFDGDGKNELLSSSSEGVISLLSHTGASYRQEWVYPYAPIGDSRTLKTVAQDINHDNRTDIIVLSDHGLYRITDLSKPMETIYEDETLTFLDVGGNDNSNASSDDLVMLTFGTMGHQVHLINANTGKIKFSYSVSAATTQVRLANVDEDEQLELVTNSGYVFDSISGENEWLFFSGFGDDISLGDIDGDGVAEIVGAPRWGKVSVYSVISKSLLFDMTTERDNICTVKTANIDSDPDSEILIGNCQWGYIYAVDVQEEKPVEVWRLDLIEHSSSSIVTGDIDNDGADEIVWGSGHTSSGPDIIAVADLGVEPQIAWSSEIEQQLLRFTSSGWGQISPGNFSTVFVAPSSSSHSGQRIIVMDNLGELRFSDETASNWNRSKHAKVIDYNHDGYADIFLGSSDLYDGFLLVKELDTFRTLWGGEGEQSKDYGIIESLDVDGDGQEDLLAVSGTRIQLLDVTEQRLFDEKVFGSHITDLLIFERDGINYLSVSTYSEVIIYEVSNSKLIQRTRENIYCERIGYRTSDASLICSEGTGYNKITSYDLDLVPRVSIALDEEVTDFIVVDDNALVASRSGVYSNEEKFYISEVDLTTGKIIWQGPNLLGPIYPRSLHFINKTDSFDRNRLTFSTENAMYLTR
ncbi:FG-GAP and VCBS repeat-containing protein [Shewanella woodyi]|uniref:FG-GAP repeat protein n=1 Tax=Shewanella woodyi (strain ATCC 51908 / MS32) TaxID=392500 RepID=B1KP62_SHEWM|nr:FG-GAP and VCBS repeat-containing protein [Shewanella woodyi]ACA89093.1 hypothetical protein Swoo_4844 [Shewanella woodyi ATCC 51908]